MIKKHITRQVVDLFEDEQAAKTWLNPPKVGLSGKTPLQAIATDAGAKQVEQLLYRAEHGIYG